MNMLTTIWLGVAMAMIAVVNVGLMAWLWRFPMVPDPTGRDPHGVSTAPRLWTNVHRGLGFLFVLLYLALLWEMVPRAWEFRVQTPIGIWHGVLGALVGVLLIIKISVIRRFTHFGNRLPIIGGSLAVVTWLSVGLSTPPAWRVVQPLTPLSPELQKGRVVVSQKCVQCHGASLIAGEREDARKWNRITRQMQEYSRRIPGKNPITDEERILAAAYLSRVLSEAESEREDEDESESGQRRRRRGRDR